MRRGLILVALLALLAAPAAARDDRYGAELTLHEKTPIPEILARPQDFAGKVVQVEGRIMEVCTTMGCWMRIGTVDGSAALLAKSTGEKVLVPTDSAGNMAIVEGVVVVEPAAGDEKPDAEGQTCPRATVRLETRAVLMHCDCEDENGKIS
jgi:hypothetical protein